MVSPSLLEFTRSLLVDEAVSLLCLSLRAGHLGNKDCVLNFNEDLAEVRQKCCNAMFANFVDRG